MTREGYLRHDAAVALGRSLAAQIRQAATREPSALFASVSARGSSPQSRRVIAQLAMSSTVHAVVAFVVLLATFNLAPRAAGVKPGPVPIEPMRLVFLATPGPGGGGGGGGWQQPAPAPQAMRDGRGIGPGSGGGTGGGPYRPGSGIEPPRLLHEVRADYTEEARQRAIAGDVVLEIVVRRDGSVGDLKILQGLGGGLNDRAVQAVRQWRFAPAQRQGTPVDVIVEVAVEFKLR